ncbi:MAG: site-specific DNA-methyltransferase [Terriglobales bacterium]
MAELIWDGKYDEHGNKRAPVRIELPFQTVETVNESAQERQRTLELSSSGNDPEWRNRLIWGDKKYVLPSLLPEFAGKVDLIYIDPPFDTGADFSFTATLPHKTSDQDDYSFLKEPSILEQKAYRDIWGRGLNSYLQWFQETAVLLRDLLSERGSIYVHLDWHVGHNAKLILDEIFGEQNFQNTVVWKRGPGKSHPKSYGHNADFILFYTKSHGYTFNKQFKELSEEYLKSFKEDKKGKYVTSPLHSGKPAKHVPAWRGVRPPHGRGWAYKIQTLEQFDREGKVEWSSEGVPRLKRYLEEIEGSVVQELWTDVKPVLGKSGDFLYPTQKPEELLDRIIKASSNENDLVLDSFCGSGTTAAVAEKLNRRWLACDLGRFAIHTTRKRLLGIPGVKPFVVQNLGKYERQAWQVAEFASPTSLSSRAEQERSLASDSAQSRDLLSSGAETRLAKSRSLHSTRASASGTSGVGRDDRALREQRERETAYRKFILELYHATPVSGHAWLHGVKGGRMVHVGAVDAPVTRADVNAIAAEVWKSKSAEKPAVDILGWEFALELNETAKEVAAQARVDAAFKKIPREVLEKKAVEQGDVHFFELGALSVDIKIKKRELTLKLSDFVIPLDDVPEEVRGAIKHWSQMVDYWAVDWDFKDDTFHNQWQSYRTRKDPKLALSKEHEYAVPGKYMVVVKVIDILGNDTTKTLEVEVK